MGAYAPFFEGRLMETDTAEIVLDQKIEKKAKKPDNYKVIIYNDDETPYEWVVALLIKIFNYSNEAAHELSNEIDMVGEGIAGVYSYEIAEQKTTEAIALSRANGYPLEINIEKD